ncbi:MAG: hypothetical protein FWF08_03155 [Oscillospiraceae bacterium]|nr:hypothetical protein [Oscillospiraceae bacterium]
MNIFNKFNIIIIIAAVLILSGCSAVSPAPAERLIRAPKLTGENALLQKAFEGAVGKDIVLKTPLSGSYRSAYVLYDFDGGETPETFAFVFYAERDNEFVARMNVLKRFENGWESIFDDAGYGSEVYEISFADMNGGGYKEVIVSWKLMDAKSNKYVYVYCYDKNGEAKGDAFKKILAEQFTVMLPIDLSGGGKTEIFTAVLDTSQTRPTAVAKLLGIDKNNKFTLLGSVNLDASASSYMDIKTDEKDGVKRLYLDGFKGENQMLTEIIYWDKEKGRLVSPLYNPKSASVTETLRPRGAECVDINGDKIIEVPSFISMLNSYCVYSAAESKAPLIMNVWSQYKDGELVPIVRYIEDGMKKYRFSIPYEWLDKIAVETDANTGVTTFSQLDTTDVNNSQLFEIYYYTAEQWDALADKTKLAELESSDKETVVFRITPLGAKFGVTANKVKEHFMRIEN